MSDERFAGSLAAGVDHCSGRLSTVDLGDFEYGTFVAR